MHLLKIYITPAVEDFSVVCEGDVASVSGYDDGGALFESYCEEDED